MFGSLLIARVEASSSQDHNPKPKKENAAFKPSGPGMQMIEFRAANILCIVVLQVFHPRHDAELRDCCQGQHYHDKDMAEGKRLKSG